MRITLTPKQYTELKKKIISSKVISKNRFGVELEIERILTILPIKNSPETIDVLLLGKFGNILPKVQPVIKPNKLPSQNLQFIHEQAKRNQEVIDSLCDLSRVFEHGSDEMNTIKEMCKSSISFNKNLNTLIKLLKSESGK